MSTPAKRAANRRYEDTLDVIRLKPSRERGAAIRAAAAAAGMSLQGYCLSAIESAMRCDPKFTNVDPEFTKVTASERPCGSGDADQPGGDSFLPRD